MWRWDNAFANSGRSQRYAQIGAALVLVGLLALLVWSGEGRGVGTATQPTFSAPPGYYDHDVRLWLYAPRGARGVIFTLDGHIPITQTGASAWFTRPLLLRTATPGVTVVRARAVLSDATLGPVVSASYFVGLSATLPLVSLIIEPEDLWDPARGLYPNPYAKGREWERLVDVTFVDRERDAGFHLPAGVRIHGHASRSYEKKSLRLYWRAEYGAARVEYPLFGATGPQTFDRLVLHDGGQDEFIFPMWDWTLLRNALAGRLAQELGGYATRSRPALLFINGQAWGIYLLRERLDERYLREQYGIADADLLDSPESDLEEVISGDRQHWAALLHYVETHDLRDPAAYAYVQTQVDIENFIGYYLLQIYAANSNWPYHNTLQFRARVPGGRWQWIFWDNDPCFGSDPAGSHVEANLFSYLRDVNQVETDGRDVLLWRGLLRNPDFRQQFMTRATEALSTTLSAEAVSAQIDALAAEIAPDIGYEVTRWNASNNWALNVESLHTFARHRPAVLRRQMEEAFAHLDTP